MNETANMRIIENMYLQEVVWKHFVIWSVFNHGKNGNFANTGVINIIVSKMHWIHDMTRSCKIAYSEGENGHLSTTRRLLQQTLFRNRLPQSSNRFLCGGLASQQQAGKYHQIANMNTIHHMMQLHTFVHTQAAGVQTTNINSCQTNCWQYFCIWYHDHNVSRWFHDII